MLGRFYAGLVARPHVPVLVALLTCVPMAYWSAELFGNVRADVKDLLPESARSVVLLHELEHKFGGFSQLSIVVESPDHLANRRFADDLTRELRKIELVRSARCQLGAEIEFFGPRRYLFIDVDDLEEIEERIENAANDARRRANPLLVDLEDQEAPAKLEFSDLEAKYEKKLALAGRFPDGYFESKDKTQLAILVRKHGHAFDLHSNQALIAHVDRVIGTLDPKSYQAGMSVELGGDVKNVIVEQEALVADLVLASAIVAVLLFLVIVAYYRSLRALYLVTVPVVVGCLWTFGLSDFIVGHLNASSAFLGPIIPGNGVNFGLILLARYFEERRKGTATVEATRAAVVYTIKATALVSLVAAVAYGSLMVTDFLGFKHFGLIGGLGMVLCWIATFVVMPPLIVWSERLFPSGEARAREALRPGVLASLPGTVLSRAPRAISWFGVVSGLASVAVSALFLRDPFEKDFNKLRSRVQTGSAASVAAKVDKIFGMYQEPQVILAEKEEDVPAIVERLEAMIREGGDQAPFSDVTALSTMVPRDQEEKLRVLRSIRALLSDDLLSNLEPADRAIAEKHRPPADLAAFGPRDLPESVRADFRELDGREGRVVLALPNMKLNLYHADEIERVAAALRSIKLPDGRVVESSGNFVIYSDMIDAVRKDGPRATVYSFGGVLLLCILAYRRARRAAFVAGSLLVGVAWLGALMAIFDLKINFLNFIALPITFGIGTDYAVNVFSRYLLERRTLDQVGAAKSTIASTGGAVLLCSLTTVIGYASLLFASSGALISFGQVAILGEVTCLIAAMLILPAWVMSWRDGEAEVRASGAD